MGEEFPIFREIKEELPKNAQIADFLFEGANIVLYTKNREFFLEGKPKIREIVDKIKKRVKLRADRSLLRPEEETKETIKEIVPEKANLDNIWFDPGRSRIVIEAKRPGLVIGKKGSTIKEIKRRTNWIPKVRRSPSIKSKLIKTVRHTLYKSSEYRRKFLNEIGEEIYKKYERPENFWVRMSFLGGEREVGRSSLLLQTPDTNILLDCGVNVAAEGKERYPLLDTPEFDIDELDAILVSHAHLDHHGFVPWVYKMGYDGPVYATRPTRDIMTLLQLDYIDITKREGGEGIYSSKAVKEEIKHSVCLDYGEVTDIAPDARLTFKNAGHILGSSLIHLNIGNGFHNILYSVDWETPIPIIKEGDLELKPIGDLIDGLIQDNPAEVKDDGFHQKLLNTENIKTVAFNPETLQNEVVEVTSFIRHPIKDPLYKVKTKSGREVKVTGSHSLFIVKNGKIKSVKVKELKEGDYLVGPKRLGIEGEEAEIDLLEEPDVRVQVKNERRLEKILKNYQKKLERNSFKREDKEVLNWIKEHFKESLYTGEIAKKYHVRQKTVSKTFKTLGIDLWPRVKSPLPDKIKITPELSRFLGYYAAEGDYSDNMVKIANSDEEILEDAKQIIEEQLDIKGNKTGDNVYFCSKQLRRLLEILGIGRVAEEKEIPKEIYLSPEEVASNFLYGYFSGDGWIRVRDSGRTISVGSKSEKLIEGCLLLLLRFNIVGRKEYDKNIKQYSLHIGDSLSQKRFLERIGMLHPRKEKLLKEIKDVGGKGEFYNRVPIKGLTRQSQKALDKTAYQNAKTISRSKASSLLNTPKQDEKILGSELFFDEIEEIKKIEPTGKWVYDLEVEGYENFLGGKGHIFLHNTGDFKYFPTRLLPPAKTDFQRLETLIIESTYGGRKDMQPSRKKSERKLFKICKGTLKNGGKVLIPVLAVGRAQEVMLMLEEAMKEGKIPKKPIYIDGMIWDISAIHTAYPGFMNNKIRKKILSERNPFLSDRFKRVGSKAERMDVIEKEGPCIILATSGMMVGGPSVSYFKRLAENEDNALIFVSYQARGSLGRRVQKGKKKFPMVMRGERRTIEVKMDVNSIRGFSGHSDRQQLMNFVKRLKPEPRRGIVVHGEKGKSLSLASAIHKTLNIETSVPRELDALRIR